MIVTANVDRSAAQSMRGCRIKKVVVAALYPRTISRKMEGDQEAQQVGTLLSYCMTCMFPAKQIYNAWFQSASQQFC